MHQGIYSLYVKGRQTVLQKASPVCETAGAAFSRTKQSLLKPGENQSQNSIQSAASSGCLMTLWVVYTMPSARTRSSIGP